MKYRRLIICIVLLLAIGANLSACAVSNPFIPPTPTTTTTNTPAPTLTPTITPTPTLASPLGTTVKTDYLGNFYAVDGEGKPTLRYNTETKKYEPFQPINFNNPEGLQIIKQEVVFTSGWYEQEINRAIAEGLWTPPSPDIQYLKAGEWMVDEKTGELPFNKFGNQRLSVLAYDYKKLDFITICFSPPYMVVKMPIFAQKTTIYGKRN